MLGTCIFALLYSVSLLGEDPGELLERFESKLVYIWILPIPEHFLGDLRFEGMPQRTTKAWLYNSRLQSHASPPAEHHESFVVKN